MEKNAEDTYSGPGSKVNRDLLVGSMLDARHSGPTKRRTEAEVEREDTRVEIVGNPNQVLSYLKDLMGLILRRGSELNRSEVHRLRQQHSKKIGSEQMKEAASLLALIFTLKELNLHGEVTEGRSSLLLLVARDGGKDKYQVETVGGSEVRIISHDQNPKSVRTLEIGDDLFDPTTGFPARKLKYELRQALKK